MFEKVKKYCDDRIKEFDQIPTDRKRLIENVSNYIKRSKNPEIVFVCTHNSRRSQMSQVWATVAAQYYKLVSTHYYSAGTESSAFHPNAIDALKRTGFTISFEEIGDIPCTLLILEGKKT